MKLIPPASLALLSVALLLNLPARGRGADGAKGPEGELVTIEHDWNEAIVRRDETILARILADDYVLTTPFGQVVSKDQLLESFKKPRDDSFEMTAIDQDEVRAQVYGDTAIVHSRFVLKGVVGDKAVKTPYRHTDVFVKTHGRWRCVSRQATAIAIPAASAAPPAPLVTSRRG